MYVQFTAKLKIGPHGPSAVQPAEEESRGEEEELFKSLRTEELAVQLWRKQSIATLTNVQVIFFFWDIISSFSSLRAQSARPVLNCVGPIWTLGCPSKTCFIRK